MRAFDLRAPGTRTAHAHSVPLTPRTDTETRQARRRWRRAQARMLREATSSPFLWTIPRIILPLKKRRNGLHRAGSDERVREMDAQMQPCMCRVCARALCGVLHAQRGCLDRRCCSCACVLHDMKPSDTCAWGQGDISILLLLLSSYMYVCMYVCMYVRMYVYMLTSCRVVVTSLRIAFTCASRNARGHTCLHDGLKQPYWHPCVQNATRFLAHGSLHSEHVS